MATPALLKVILGDNNSQRLTFPDGLPASVSELVDIVQRQCAIQTNFRLQFMDPLFNNEFMNLTSMDEVKDRGTIRVIYIAVTSTPERMDVQISSGSACNYSFLEENSSVSSGNVDTDILSSPDSDASTCSTSRTSWPSTFNVPQFGFDAELKLERGNAAFRENGKVLIPDLKLKSNILEGLIQEIVKFKVYVTDREFNMVGEALVSKHPCLKERGSVTGYAGWKASLKNKLAIYRTHLRKLGCPEVLVNSIKHKPVGKSSAASAIKRPRRSEVNYCPPYPTGESDQSLEGLRVELLSDVKKRNNREAVRRKMDQTFAYRRYEVVRDKPMVEDFKNRWPALFDVTEINLEFKRITTIPLQSRFLSQIDVLSNKLLKLFERRGGQIGRMLEDIVSPMAQEDDVDLSRSCIIKGLCVYLNEEPGNLVKEYVGTDETSERSIEETTVGIYVLKADCNSKPDDIGIVIEGQVVLQELDNFPLAVAMLFGLIYTLNLDYPRDLKYTFEVLQKIIMELEGTTLSKKAQVLKNRLYE